MIFPVLLLLQSPASLPTLDEVKLDECLKLAAADPAAGGTSASEWIAKGGHWRAHQCLGFAYFKAGKPSDAAKSYEQAAQLAAAGASSISGKLWAQAGNAALVAREPRRAITSFDKAIATGSFAGEALGEVHLDRARAYAAAGDMVQAQLDLDKAHIHVPQDPLGWLLSATLARRNGNLVRAKADIAVAAKLASRDPAIALEAGNIAISGGDNLAARTNWQLAIDLAPASAYAVSAKSYLAQLGADTVTPQSK